MRFLLDTCTFIWLALPQGKLSDQATHLINDLEAELFLSDVSAWEITMKHSAGKLDLPMEPRRWLPTRMAFFQVNRLPMTPTAIFTSGELPRVHHDPFDRLLAAQAMEEGMTILSPDVPISLLGASRVW